MNTRLFSAAQAVGSLVFGATLYILFRKNTVAHNALCLKGIFSEVKFPLDDFFRYYFPDFLWSYSLCSSLLTVYPQKTFRVSCTIPWLSFGLGIIFETAQYFHCIPGTSDIADVLLYLSAAFAAYGIIIYHSKRRKTQ